MTEGNAPKKGKVVIADALDASAIDLLKEHFEVLDVSKEPGRLPEAMAQARGLLVRSRTKVDAALLEKAPALEVIGRAGVGVDNIDVLAAHKRGIVVVNAPGAAAQSVAELTVGLLVAIARDFGSHIPSLKEGKWTKGTNGLELSGRTVGLIGYGRIGREVAKRLRAFGMKIQAYDPYVTKADDGTSLVSLDDLLATSDVVSLHAAAMSGNQYLLDRAAFARMRKGVLILNVARGKLIEEAALIEALESGRVAGAGLDVFEEEPPRNPKLYQHPKVVGVPHIGASTREAQEKAGRTVAEDVLRVLQGETPEFPVHV